MAELLTFKGDLHIHSVLSPCGSLDMSPRVIVEAALEKGMDMIGITDHNSTRNAKVLRKIAREQGLFVLMGAEVATQEEVHCLCFFEFDDELDAFQQYLKLYLPPIPNNTDVFGHQCVVDEEERILDEEEYYLVAGIEQSINQVEKKVHDLNGLFIPAHINRPSMSLMSQLGFIPARLKADAFEMYRNSRYSDLIEAYPLLQGKTLIRSSDAHFPDQVGSVFTRYRMKALSFQEFRLALAAREGRGVER